MAEIPIIKPEHVNGKVVLIRVDHNVVKNGKVDDPYRIERSKSTIDLVIENGGFPVLMTHIGRPRDKKTGDITLSEDESVAPLVEYIREKWGYDIRASAINTSNANSNGLSGLDDTINAEVADLKSGKFQLLYLPNTRWFAGEEEKQDTAARDKFTNDLTSIADVFVNDAFGSHQAHISTYGITRKLPSFSGLLMAEEIQKLEYLLDLPENKHPFLSIVAGKKIDTKIGALRSLRDVSDNLLLGGLPASALICAKYNVTINGISEDEIEIARQLLKEDEGQNKLLVPYLVVQSDVECSEENQRQEGKYREIDLREVEAGTNLGYIYDISENYFKQSEVIDAIKNAKTIFTNAVVGFDKAGFVEGTKAFYNLLAQSQADQSFGGGDTLKALRRYTPDFYKSILTDPRHVLFTGGGTILNGFESKGVEEMKVIKALTNNGGKSQV